MSINSAMQAGVTGLITNSSALSAISDNIANANTVGYKRVGVDFSTLVSLGSDTGYSAGGVVSANRQYVTQQGTLQATSSTTDLGIAGNGFFVTTDKATDVSASDPRYFTRAGAFTVDSNGFLKNDAGLYLQGWPADANGNVVPDAANLTSLEPINVLNVGNTAHATTTVSVNGNLNADQTLSAGLATYNAATNNMAMYASNPTTGVKPDFSITVPVADSKGGQRNIVVDFLRSGPNTWDSEIRSDPPGNVSATNGLIASGTVAFNADGSVNMAGTTLPLSGDGKTVQLTLGASAGPALAANGSTNWSTALGAGSQTMNIDLSGMNQFASASAVSSISTNGTAFGSMAGLSIDQQGYVTAVYDNGTTRRIAQVAVATFPNPDGLKAVNGNAYQTSAISGGWTLKTAGSAGAGKISPSSLEASTVDLSSEFTGLITTQRAYAASSKIITTADQMLQELINIKQ